MAPSPAALPGFFYDPVRQKYFRILPNHVAPEGSKYSAENVEQDRREAKRRKLQQERDERVAKETIRRSHLLGHTITAASLGREMGTQTMIAGQVARSKLFASLLGKKFDLKLRDCDACRASDTVLDYALTTSQNVIFGTGDDQGRSGLHIRWRGAGEDLSYTDECTTLLPGIRSPITSVNMTDGGAMLATATGGNSSNVFIAPILTNSDAMDRSLGMHVEMDLVGLPDWEIRTSYLQPGWADDIGIVLSNSTSARGGLLKVIDIGAGQLAGAKVFPDMLRNGDFLDENVAVTADYNDTINLFDLRTASRAPRFRAVDLLSVKGVNDGHTLWAATASRIHKFDVRMPATFKRYTEADVERLVPGNARGGGQGRRRWRRERRATYRDASLPVLEIDRPDPTGQGEMAVWLGTGLLASRTDSNDIALYSTEDGSLVRTIPESGDRRENERYWVKNMKVFLDRLELPVLYYAKGPVVQSLQYGRKGFIYKEPPKSAVARRHPGRGAESEDEDDVFAEEEFEGEEGEGWGVEEQMAEEQEDEYEEDEDSEDEGSEDEDEEDEDSEDDDSEDESSEVEEEEAEDRSEDEDED